MSKFFKKTDGFTLIEMLIYIAVLVLMLAVILEVVLSVTRSDRLIKATRHIENATVSGIERIAREVRGAGSVSLASSTLNVHPGVLMLIGTDDDGNPRTVEFTLVNGRLMLKENGIDQGALTGEEAEITTLKFSRFASSTIEGIRTEMTLESGTSTHYRSENFYSAVLLR